MHPTPVVAEMYVFLRNLLNSIFSIESHRSSHNVVYQTARMDLLNLANLDLLVKEKIGKGFLFTVQVNLKDKLEKFGN